MRVLLKVEERDTHHRECQRQDAMFAHWMANGGSLLQEAEKVLRACGQVSLADRIEYFLKHDRPMP